MVRAKCGLAQRPVRAGDWGEATTGQFTDHHAFLIRMHLDLIDRYGQALTALDDRIAEALEPFRAARELLTSIPGFMGEHC
ncbi:hypothetical protein [Rhodococcus sp. As11]|uniref:hypothetical protein n=1 Tax=Rhodococcus sp. As11 TaxID=3029189 RepID=UPI003B7A21FE